MRIWSIIFLLYYKASAIFPFENDWTCERNIMKANETSWNLTLWCHLHDVTSDWWRLISSTTQMFVQNLILTDNKDVTKSLNYHPFVRILHRWHRSTVDSKHQRPVMDPSHKSHNASGKCHTVHRVVTEMCTDVHISVTKWCIVGYGTCAL